ncbi:hypothetical protein [Streptomyces sp. NPDC060027]|uniref:hypothetical protein n=1 Tax=Streptomyces sp. NPDC060027 TaxID=3347040 RepID=UPI0036BF9B8D
MPRFRYTAPVTDPSTGNTENVSGRIETANPSKQRAQIAAAADARKTTGGQVDANDVTVQYDN